MDIFPLEGDEVPEGYKGWLILLDEFLHASVPVMRAAYKLILDRAIGDHNLHEKVAIACASNLQSDNAHTEEMGTAMQTRLIHLFMNVNPEGWLNWARSNGIDSRIQSFITWRNDLLDTFDSNAEVVTYAVGRTWEFLSNIIDGMDNINHANIELISGAIGEGTAREFLTYLAIYDKLISVKDILADPKNAKVPEEPGHRYAMTGMLAEEIDKNNAKDILIYLDRMPLEFRLVTMKMAIGKDTDLMDVKPVSKWLDVNAEEFF